ncbi:putative HTH-type transcriptional regulator FruR [Anaerocolumna cellulosilytica]|uniref:Putative HTH-type transcriptional regulator FruR n=1 Tax=Anaerocolumna cellulosilytica TaxID=433286 RepID=A0A6S6QXC4_9FIRM|nr:DeoR/GlpR family DNA-binding transcription regulator [Anaerocolumna cellulosilytica]MBB5194662.1 DeoR family fructose operon transcriptional repressor [Anaerocolumna cellulosilytica]BCJ94376.1 putative HTH-type transcriptional regulator FruR [Anaerocolumna cellulosilytica]
MLTESRLNEIVRLVDEKKSMTVLELTKELQISESTIRRDLTILQKKGLIKKVHGGATTLDLGYMAKDDEVSFRSDLNREDKICIAKYAAGLLQDNDFVYLDAGTTTELLIDYIEEKNAVFVTNGIVHGKKLAQRGFKVYMLGGELKASTEAVVGADTIAVLNKYHFTKGFFGTNGVSIATGFTTPDVNEAAVKRKALEQTKDKYILCDASKFNKISPVCFWNYEAATIITNGLTDKIYLEQRNVIELEK